MVTSKKPGVLSRLGGHTRRNLIAYLALFVALGGTSAYAAKALITGAQIEDNTIESIDVKDGTLTAVDVANNAFLRGNGVVRTRTVSLDVGQADDLPLPFWGGTLHVECRQDGREFDYTYVTEIRVRSDGNVPFRAWSPTYGYDPAATPDSGFTVAEFTAETFRAGFAEFRGVRNGKTVHVEAAAHGNTTTCDVSLTVEETLDS